MGFDDAAKQKKFYDQFTENSLMKRIGDVDDIANLVSFVASDDARNITGRKSLNANYLIYKNYLTFTCFKDPFLSATAVFLSPAQDQISVMTIVRKSR